MFKLVIQDDEGKTTVVPLIRDEITIGRKEGNTIRLTERNVSRRHARILRNNGEVQIEDLGSYNGIRVNNARIAERVSLRISDQVQIGDYKLYLKAEGVEQVDDARTMPIERIDNALPTEVMPAVQQSAAPAAPTTTPMPAAIPGTPPPNRSPVAVADTDPQGRPVATAAQVAALSAPVGYGKLCVLSSNYAGKEFDLTRPQMIIGRTDENDIVINHRSISRNHAKITRDPESGRYTISDLQSSNGVRVNGQDYGKVELRRGDTVDLGHVRLRFVEPGEDFVFNSSMVADIPETGSKRGLLVAIILGVLVLGGVGAFFFLNKKDTTQTAGGQKTDLGSQKGSGDVVADNGNGGGSEIAVNPVTTDGSGSETNTMVKPPPDDVAGNLALECKGYQAEAKWTDLSRCGEKLAKLDATEGKKFGATAASEIKAEGTLADLRKEKDFAKAKRQSDAISKDSYYRKDADARIEELKAHDVGQAVSKAEAMKSKGQCDQIARLANDIKDKYGPEWGQRVAEQKQGCVESTGGNTGTTTVVQKDCSTRLVDNSKSCKTQFCKANPNDSNCATGQTTVTAPANCDAEALKDKGMENVNMGQHAAALAQFEASLRCKKDDYVLALAFMAACNAQNAAKAKSYYGKLNPSAQTKYKVMCIRNHIDPAVP